MPIVAVSFQLEGATPEQYEEFLKFLESKGWARRPGKSPTVVTEYKTDRTIEAMQKNIEAEFNDCSRMTSRKFIAKVLIAETRWDFDG